jgi:hypothetical protein
MNTIRNALKNMFSKLPAGGGGGGAAAADALGKVVVLGATLGVGVYGVLHAMYTGAWVGGLQLQERDVVQRSNKSSYKTLN